MGKTLKGKSNMSSMIRTFAREKAREGKEIRIVKGVQQYVKVRQTEKEYRKEHNRENRGKGK
jgi:hypothetical protein